MRNKGILSAAALLGVRDGQAMALVYAAHHTHNHSLGASALGIALGAVARGVPLGSKSFAGYSREFRASFRRALFASRRNAKSPAPGAGSGAT